MDVSPANLIRPDLLHMFLGIVEYSMDWIEGFLTRTGFLTVHNRLNAFDDIWAQMPAYPENHVPQKLYRSLSQVLGKEMRAILWVLLGVFTAPYIGKLMYHESRVGSNRSLKRQYYVCDILQTSASLRGITAIQTTP